MSRSFAMAVAALLATGAAALAATSYAGSYTGTETMTTGSGGSISITVTGSSITRIIYTADYTGGTTCTNDSGRQKLNARTGVLKIKNGKVNGSVTPFAKDTIKVKATFSGTGATGTLSENFTPLHQHVTCKSGTISFNAPKT